MLSLENVLQEKINLSHKTVVLEASGLEQKALNTAVRAGELMIRSGAEAYRCEDTTKSILSLAGQEYDSFVLGTGLIVTLKSQSNLPLTITKRVKTRGMNLNVIDAVNQIARDLVDGKINFDEAEKKLDLVEHSLYSEKLKLICSFLMTASFALLLSGNLFDALGGFLNGFLLVSWRHLAAKYRFRAFSFNVIAGFLISIGSVFLTKYLLPQANVHFMIGGSLMLLFPGTSFTTAVRDSLHGDFVSGLTRMAEALLTALSLSIGVGLGLFFFNTLS